MVLEMGWDGGQHSQSVQSSGSLVEETIAQSAGSCTDTLEPTVFESYNHIQSEWEESPV